MLPWPVLPVPQPPRKLPARSKILAELLPIVGEVNAVLDPDELLPAIARQLRRIVDYRILDIFLPEEDGTLAPAFVDGYDQRRGGVAGCASPPGRGSWARPPSRGRPSSSPT